MRLTFALPDLINLTIIGTGVFVSMDLPDICLAVSRVVQPTHLRESTLTLFSQCWDTHRFPSVSTTLIFSTPRRCRLFSSFACGSACLSTITDLSSGRRLAECPVYSSYMRHYLNILILISVWNEFDLIPIANRTWQASAAHPDGWWLFYGGLGSGQLPAWMKCALSG